MLKGTSLIFIAILISGASQGQRPIGAIEGRPMNVTVILDGTIIRDTAISYPLLRNYGTLIRRRKPYSVRKAFQKFGENTIDGLLVCDLINGYRLDTLTFKVIKEEE